MTFHQLKVYIKGMLPGWYCKLPVILKIARKGDFQHKNNLEMVLLIGRGYNFEGTGNWQRIVKRGVGGLRVTWRKTTYEKKSKEN